ncbi:uncharacterized protein G2W53_031548 [Senna tora]|uniref:Uncharacterized protein n=1 Tax=Senna tora TaxID=362788 RepID=A0A834WHV0_9FABA|nr:uncharacterized protein G2W53_031548 [Senna tora]
MEIVGGERERQGMVDKAKEAGITQETIEQAANSEEAQKALKDGTAQQALNDAEDAAGGSSSTWGDWVKNTVGNIGFGKESGNPAAPSPVPEDSVEGVDIEVSPAGAPETENAPVNSPVQESSPSPSPSPSSSSPSPSPSPSIEAPSPAPVDEATPTAAPASSPL